MAKSLRFKAITAMAQDHVCLTLSHPEALQCQLPVATIGQTAQGDQVCLETGAHGQGHRPMAFLGLKALKRHQETA